LRPFAQVTPAARDFTRTGAKAHDPWRGRMPGVVPRAASSGQSDAASTIPNRAVDAASGSDN